MNALFQLTCWFCLTFGSPPVPQTALQDHDIHFTYEKLGRGTHLLRLSTTDLIIDNDHERAQRLQAFAYQFADATCRGRFKLAPAERASWPVVRPIYAKQYIFHCR